MDFEYIINQYKVPAEMFREVSLDGRKGVITEDKGQYLGVTFYDDKNLNCLPCHPTWKMEYLETFNRKPPNPKNLAGKQRYRDYLELDLDMTFFQYLKSL